jgi:hypothetical protein
MNASAHAAAGSEFEPPGGGQRIRGDVYVGSMAAGTRRVPGSGTARGRMAIMDLMHDALARVRRHITERR